MTEYKYMRIPVATTPEKNQHHYEIPTIAHNGSVMVNIRWGMDGLPQAGILANVQLGQHLTQHGYHQTQHTHGLYRHETRNISFNLVVENFGIKYTDRVNIDYLLNTIWKKYMATVDISGSLYCGLTLDWKYHLDQVDISMPGYREQSLAK